METPLKFLISLILFWVLLGGIMQIGNDSTDSQANKLNPNTEKTSSLNPFKLIGFLWDMMTFNIDGMPENFRAGMNTFMVSALGLNIYVLLRSGS